MYWNDSIEDVRHLRDFKTYIKRLDMCLNDAT